LKLKTIISAALWLATPLAYAQTATITDLADYPSGFGNGETLGLLQASDGNFYFAPTNTNYIFRVTPSGTISSLKGQLDSSCGNGIVNTLLEGPDGDLYGVTGAGGVNGAGTIFSYSLTTKTCTLVFSYPASGEQQPGTLRLGSDGNFYGVMRYGGTNTYGMAYRVSTTGTGFLDLYDFDALMNANDGDNPVYDMLEATDGNWYGVTGSGGTSSEGVLYQLTPGFTTPWQEAQLIDFASQTGVTPLGGPFERSDDNIYGLTSASGPNNQGAVYESDTFDNNPNAAYFGITNDGAFPPSSPPVIGGDGNVYITKAEGSGINGGLSQINLTAKTETLLGGFEASTIYNPGSYFEQGADGNFYGVANSGGANNEGGVWKAVVSPAVTPPITMTVSSTAPPSGSSVKINYTVRNVTSKSAAQCYAYEYIQQGGFNVPSATGGTWSGKLSGTISGTTITGSGTVSATAAGTYVYAIECQGRIAGLTPAVTFTGVAAVATKTVLAAAPNPVSYGSAVSLTATVTKTSGPGTPSGQVSFNAGTIVLATTNLNTNGVAILTANTSGYAIGAYPITAYYKGDSADNTSTSNTVNVALKNGTSTHLAVSENTVPHNGSITVSATATQTTGPSAPKTPTGSVTFYVNGGLLLSANLNASGVASFTSSTAGYPVGTYSLTAVYDGNTADNSSTSNVQKVTLQ
jgi:uncharacterized repeat protein (TIGR03803 family)